MLIYANKRENDGVDLFYFIHLFIYSFIYSPQKKRIQ